jgi:valyl-tRNA synthetase
MSEELSKAYEPGEIEAGVSRRWLEARAFAACPDERENRYVIMMPLPNVTGALHIGHAMDNVMQDLLIRWHRMMGDNTLWLPGTDHAGIATQAVVEKRLFELEGKTRYDVGREGLVAKIWEWKEQYQARIIEQQQQMGCSCDWDRQRFTMDEVCAAAVRRTFFRLFGDGLIYRGDRIVNWDCHLQTAVSDDEIVRITKSGHFWHIRYPVIEPRDGEPDHVTVATTRPETMLGDTAVAVHPDPEGALESQLALLSERLSAATEKEKPDLEQELGALKQRRATHLPRLKRLAEMARDGRKVRLPLIGREIPLILDTWAKPELGSGCVKITPAHDPNDYDVWTRHQGEIGAVNILNPDGTLNASAGGYEGLDRFAGRKLVVKDLDEKGLLEAVEDREIEIGHSDRSKTPIEPYLSRQWFVRMGDVEGGVVFGKGTPGEFSAPGLAQAAMDAAGGEWTSYSGRRLTFHPDPARYSGTYLSWLSEKRDWCISRQLWWGHRIPVWLAAFDDAGALRAALGALPVDEPGLLVRIGMPDGVSLPAAAAETLDGPGPFELLVCPLDEAADEKHGAALVAAGLAQDPDVLDTWFSSALWPHSTLGWPDPETARINEGQSPLAAAGRPDTLSYYYPGSCLVTARDIITLWVARMLVMGLYNLGDVPFTDCFIHANIQDGKGERMSKSKGNGIDPVDIIEKYGTDAMRYVLCEMQTGTQDIRLPVQAISPFTGELVDLAKAKHGRSIFTYICPGSGKEFDVLGTMADIPAAKVTSDRFEVGRGFANKLWNAVRFALMNLGEHPFTRLSPRDLAPEDRWILSRLGGAVRGVTRALEEYNPSAAIGLARKFFWGDLCDWYLEMIKPRMKDEAQAPVARSVLAVALDRVLRLFHPFIPFITEALWERLNAQVPVRGIETPLPSVDLLITANWPDPSRYTGEPQLEAEMELMQSVIHGIRDLRWKYEVPPSRQVEGRIRIDGDAAEILARLEAHIRTLAGLSTLEIGGDIARPALAATAVVGECEIFLAGVLDPVREKERLDKQLAKLRPQLESTEKKLANENFVSRAKPEVVQVERDRLAEMQGQIARLEENVQRLTGEE